MNKLQYYTDSFLDSMRQATDPLADQAITDLMADRNSAHFREVINSLTTNGYQLPSGLPSSVVHFFETTRQLPEWANERMIQRGQQFFENNISDLLLMLALMSLPFDYAAANGAQVLYLSERLRYDQAKRLAETGQYLLDVGERNSFSLPGRAICSAQKVRLTHAAVRYHIRRQDGWNDDWGQPINQEDMAGTNLTMSLLPIRGMRKIGGAVSPEDAQAYIHLWNVASYIMGVDERLLPDTSKEAFWLIKRVADRQHRPSEAGQALTQSLLKAIPQDKVLDNTRLATLYMRFLLGNETADLLALPPSDLPQEWLSAPVKGFNQLRRWMGNRAQAYYATRQRLMKELKEARGEAFAVPNTLRPASR